MNPTEPRDLFSQPPTAEQLADEGAARAADHADRTTGGEWTEQASRFTMQLARSCDHFQCSDVRDAAEGKIPAAPDQRAWGAVIKALHRAGHIRPIGYGPTSRRTSHGRQEQRWVVVAR